MRQDVYAGGGAGAATSAGSPSERPLGPGVHGVPKAGWALGSYAWPGGPQARVLGRAGGGLGEGRPSPRGSASGSGGSAGDGSGSPMMIRQHGSQYIQARTAGLCPHRMHGLVIIRRPAWRLGPVGAGRRSDTPRRTEPASRRRPSTSDTATPGRRSPPPRGPRLTGRATW